MNKKSFPCLFLFCLIIFCGCKQVENDSLETNLDNQKDNVVIDIEFKEKAQDERQVAFFMKRNADNVYAGVSMKACYNIAVEKFRQGDREYEMQNFKNAYESYSCAKNIFTELYERLHKLRELVLKCQELESN